MLYYFYRGPDTEGRVVMYKKNLFISRRALNVFIDKISDDGIYVNDDKVAGREIPEESMFMPADARISSTLQLKKYIRGMEIIKKIE